MVNNGSGFPGGSGYPWFPGGNGFDPNDPSGNPGFSSYPGFPNGFPGFPGGDPGGFPNPGGGPGGSGYKPIYIPVPMQRSRSPPLMKLPHVTKDLYFWNGDTSTHLGPQTVTIYGLSRATDQSFPTCLAPYVKTCWG